MTRNAEALVIGGGPVGLFAALSLSNRGMSVEVFDAAGERAVRGYACGLHPETLRIFDRVGLMPAILEAAHRVDRLVLLSGARPCGTAEFAALEGAYPYALTLRQFDLEDILKQTLAGRGLNVHHRHSVTQLCPRNGFVNVSGEAAAEPGTGAAGGERPSTAPIAREADFVIGADGYFSACRRALGIDLAIVRPTRAFAVCEFNADLRQFSRDACITFSGDATSAFWPLGPELGRLTFQIWEHLDQPMSLDRLRELIRELAPWFTPQPEQLCWGAVAPFEHPLARSFGRGRIWLAGDAAHSTSPIGLHSMNRGFCEVDRLSALFASALFDEDYRSERFEEFEKEQQDEWSLLFGRGPRAREGFCDLSELAPCLPASGDDFVHDPCAPHHRRRPAAERCSPAHATVPKSDTCRCCAAASSSECCPSAICTSSRRSPMSIRRLSRSAMPCRSTPTRSDPARACARSPQKWPTVAAARRSSSKADGASAS